MLSQAAQLIKLIKIMCSKICLKKINLKMPNTSNPWFTKCRKDGLVAASAPTHQVKIVIHLDKPIIKRLIKLIKITTM